MMSTLRRVIPSPPDATVEADAGLSREKCFRCRVAGSGENNFVWKSGAVSKRRSASANPLPPAPLRSPISGWDLATAGLFLCRWLVPAEGVDQGQTLWIAAAWLALAAVRFWRLCRFPEPVSFHWGWGDLGVAALVAGHCLSGLLVGWWGGDLRAALNCGWEWISIAALWLLLRERMQDVEFRRYFCFCLLVTLTTLSGWGLWQHFVWYPQQSRDLTRLLQLQEDLSTGHVLDAASKSELTRLRGQFGTEVLSLEEGARAMLLARTRDSREPIGRFALANSFAALLILGWFLAADQWRYCLSVTRTRTAVMAGLAVFSVMTFCLFLTKSRTALIGVMGGLCLGGIRLLLRAKLARGRVLIRGGLLAAGGMMVVAVLMWTGGLDRQVFSEAPKSLAYRLEYWQATWQMIQDHPVFGVGPGNFRQHYFAFKLPGASEEILDPHNLILDVWANGGLLALAGLLVLIARIAVCFWQRMSFEEEGSRSRIPSISASTWLLTGVAAFGVIGAEEWLLEGFFDWHLAWLGSGWMIIGAALSRCLPEVAINPAVAGLAAVALLIHLLGAGGIGMPAILQLLLFLLLVLTSGTVTSDQKAPFVVSPWRLQALCGIFSVLLIGCLWSGLVPVVTVGRLLEQGRYEAFVEHRFQAAENHFQQATRADRLAAAPHDELAALAFERWKREEGDNDELFQAAITEKQAALQRNPRAAKEYLTLSTWWSQRYQRHADPEFAQQAVNAARTGVRLYPNFVRLQTQLAVALSAAGDTDTARQAARTALRLDDLNRERGHTDKVLPVRQRDELRSLLKETE